MIRRIIKGIAGVIRKIRSEIAWAKIRVDFRNRKGWAQ